jgi:phage FluMu gp28-like protein
MIATAQPSRRVSLSRYFLPYQAEAILSDARLALYEKSVRIGITYAMGFRAVRRRLIPKCGDLLYTTVTAEMAKEFVSNCKTFCRVFEAVEGTRVDESDVREEALYNPITDRQESSFRIDFKATGQAIRAFSSNPSALRGAGGEVNVDELSSHLQPEEMLKAAGSRAMWGDPCWIWSSHRGEDSVFYQMVQRERARGAKSSWKIFSTDLMQAIAQGLLDKIAAVKGIKITKDQFVAETVDLVGGEDAFQEECMLIPRKGGAAAIKWSYIQAAQTGADIEYADIRGDDQAAIDSAVERILNCTDPKERLEIGYDVARKGHLSAIPVLTRGNSMRRLAALVTIQDAKFGTQRGLIEKLMTARPAMVGLGDSTGLGMQVCEELEAKFGKARFSGVNFSSMKPELGTGLVRVFEDLGLLLPASRAFDFIAADLAGIRTQPMPGGRTQFYESANAIEKRSHCDIAWAIALAVMAGAEAKQQGMW